MRKANLTNKVLFVFTLFFMLIAVFSFVVFQPTAPNCTQMANCTQETPTINTGEMIWDVLTRHLISFVSIR